MFAQPALAAVLAGALSPTQEGNAQEAAASPPKADLLFMSAHEGNAEIYLRVAGEEEWLNLSRDPAGDNWPVWSPDGARIAFQSDRGGRLDVYVMAADGSELRRLTRDPAHDYLPAWAPDGESLTFSSWRQEAGDDGEGPFVCRMNADGTDPERLLAEPLLTSAGAHWSPDGMQLVVGIGDGASTAHLHLMDSDGMLEEQITEGEVFCGAARYSPDGRAIAFHCDDQAHSRIVVLDLDSEQQTVIVDEGQNWYPRWSPDGRWLQYTAGAADDAENLELWAVPVDRSAKPRVLLGGPARQAEGSWRPATRPKRASR